MNIFVIKYCKRVAISVAENAKILATTRQRNKAWVKVTADRAVRFAAA